VLSGDFVTAATDIDTVLSNVFWPEAKDVAEIWEDANRTRRFHLCFPFYPFRTLNPRHMSSVTQNKIIPSDINYNSPIFPAHTQIDIVFKKNKNTNFINFMLPYKLDFYLGSKRPTLTNAERENALSYELDVITRGEDGNNITTEVDRIVDRIEIKVKDCYLQVSHHQ